MHISWLSCVQYSSAHRLLARIQLLAKGVVVIMTCRTRHRLCRRDDQRCVLVNKINGINVQSALAMTHHLNFHHLIHHLSSRHLIHHYMNSRHLIQHLSPGHLIHHLSSGHLIQHLSSMQGRRSG